MINSQFEVNMKIPSIPRLILLILFIKSVCCLHPIVINTWPFTNATDAAWEALTVQRVKAVDAVVAGCSRCERQRCDGTVGYGGSPDENGETTLDAMIMDGITHNVGSVGGLRRVKDAIAVAKAVMQYTTHTMLSGDLATEFAKSMNFEVSNLSTPATVKRHSTWVKNNCQPNFRRNVKPDPTKNCGPYSPQDQISSKFYDGNRRTSASKTNHDTIGMVVIDNDGDLAAGTSTNGLTWKVPGRVGDSPIAGAGSYADNEVGGAAATGDGDVMMRFLPSFLAVEEMRRGATPTEAARTAIRRIIKYYPNFSGALIAINKRGETGASCNRYKSFPYSVRNEALGETKVIRVDCLS